MITRPAKNLIAPFCRRPMLGRTIPASVLLFSLLAPTTCLAGAQASYMYKLSDFQGPVSSLWARITVDSELGEVYSLNQKDKAIQIFNETAMQIFGFGEDLPLATASDICSGSFGDMYVVFNRPSNRILQLDYKGDIIREIIPTNLPDNFQPFQADFLDYKNGSFYLAASEAMQVVVLSQNGEFQKGYDFRSVITEQLLAEQQQGDLSKGQLKKLEDDLKAMQNAAFGGFAVDSNDNLYFTAASLFSAFRCNPSGTLEQFGVPGGAVSKFGVVAGIQADSKGNIYISDRLRCVVLVFDKNFEFLTEFGYRGGAPQNLIVPDDIAIDEQNNKIYVSQAANLGVSVFSLKPN